eukprot:COSAG02_NODE_14401_length_1276_cov_1.685641_1_plen_86_part_10
MPTLLGTVVVCKGRRGSPSTVSSLPTHPVTRGPWLQLLQLAGGACHSAGGAYCSFDSALSHAVLPGSLPAAPVTQHVFLRVCRVVC